MAVELLQQAARRGDIKEVGFILGRGRVPADVVILPSNTTPLHIACRVGCIDMVSLLLSYRANPAAKEIAPCGGRTPLHLAAALDAPTIVLSLLEAGASPVALDARGLTPLHVAAQEGRCDVARVLLAHGADPHIRDSSGCNAAWWASKFGHAPVEAIFMEMQIPPRNVNAALAIARKKSRAASAGIQDGASAKSGARYLARPEQAKTAQGRAAASLGRAKSAGRPSRSMRPDRRR